jgi:uncharacterized protein
MPFAVDVCYAPPEGAVFLETVMLDEGASVKDAIERSGLLAAHPEVDLSVQKVGVFGKLRPLESLVAGLDRVEVYRALKVDPKAARQRRVEKGRRAGSIEGRKWQSKDSR